MPTRCQIADGLTKELGDTVIPSGHGCREASAHCMTSNSDFDLACLNIPVAVAMCELFEHAA